MKVTGYKLQHAIREAETTKNVAASQWDGSLYRFAGESKRLDPYGVMRLYQQNEDRVVCLQTAQARYNLTIEVDILGQKMTLCEAVKRVGGAGRAEKMWRGVATGEKKDRYSYDRDLVRNKDEERAVPTMSVEAALESARVAARYAAALRMAIQTANAIEIDLEGVDPSLFE
jgi:hypothetical protein